MTASEIIRQVQADGVTLRLFNGKLKAAGPAPAVRHWRPVLVEHKAAIIEALMTADQSTSSERSLWCLDHQNSWPDGHCPYREDLEHCELWQAIRHRRTLQ